MNRAWSVLEIKSFDDEQRTFEGIATTPNTDRMDDIVEPDGARFTLPIPMLWQHGKGEIKDPIGWITDAKITKDGIVARGQMAKPKDDYPQKLRDELNGVWVKVRDRIVRGLSIGFNPIEAEPIKGTFGTRFKVWDWLELSPVAIAANADASIHTIKAIDEQQQAALGHSVATSPTVRIKLAGASASPKSNAKETKVNIQENIAGFEAKRAASLAAKEAILAKLIEDGETPSAEESEKVKQYEGEIDSIDSHLITLRNHEKQMVVKATPILPISGVQSDEAKQKVKQGEFIIRADPKLPPGIGMARYVKALAYAKGNLQMAQDYAKQWESSTPEVGMALKTAVGAGTTTDSVWAGPLVYAQDFPAAFLDFLRPQTIIGKLTGLKRVPFNIRYGIQDGGSTVGWVGQGLPKAATKLHFTSGSLGFAKAAGIVIITQELARFSSPSAELTVRDDLAAQMVQFLDAQFIDPGVAAVANVSPASVTNLSSNIRQAANAWTSMANVLTDVKVFLTTFSSNEISLAGAQWVMTPDVALSLGLLLNTGGTAFAFPAVDVNGGTFLGLPVIVSNSVPHSTSAGSIVALIVPQMVYMADDGGIAIDASTEASIQMDDAPGTQNATTGTGTSLVSMFQTNSIAVRVERIINWARARAYGVGYIDNVHTS